VLIALHKPFGFLSQFTPEPGSKWRTLADFNLPPKVYSLGRLDADSEGLLLLSDEPGLNAQLLKPKNGHRREYWVQVEGIVSDEALAELSAGVTLRGQRTLPCIARRLDPAPPLPPRDPPIRVRKTVPDSWISLALIEGKNRQVRRMTAAAGLPTLRLHRAAVGDLLLDSLDLTPGNWRELSAEERTQAIPTR
jgi:23S rRNA pseudouridine2457 synthase